MDQQEVRSKDASLRSSPEFKQIVLFTANALGFLASFATPLLLVRYLPVLEYGLFKQAFLLITIVVYLLPFGYSASAFYFLPRQSPAGQSKVVMNIVVVHATIGVLACATLMVWPALLSLLFGGFELVDLASLIGIVILVWSISRLSEVVTIANGEIKIAALFIVFGQATRAILLILAAAKFGSMHALLLAAIIQGLIQSFAFLLYLAARFPGFWRSIDLGLMRQQLFYALPLGSAALIFSGMIELPSFFVSHKLGAEFFAIYSVGLFLLPLASVCVEPISAAVLRPICELQKSGDNRQIAIVLSSTTRLLAILLFPISALMWVTGREWIEVLFTTQYSASAPILFVSLFMIPLRAAVTDPIFRGFAEHRFFPLKMRCVLLALMASALALVPASLGAVGIISIVVVFFAIDRLLEILKIWRILELGWRDALLFKDVAVIAFVAACSAVATVGFKTVFAPGGGVFNVIFTSSFFAASYLVLLILTRILPISLIARVTRAASRTFALAMPNGRRPH